MDSQALNCLNLEGNQITKISPEAFKLLPNIYYLNLARNLIPTSKLMSFNGHMHLKTLILDENMLDKKYCDLRIQFYFLNLENLYLRNDGICNISPNLKTNLPKLSHLYLTQNKIQGELEVFDNMPSTLTHLYLEKNLIRRFNTTMIKNIEFLALDDNKIQIICNTYCHKFSLSLNSATNLKYLSVSGNDIIGVEPDAFDDTFNLKSLNLSNNKIQIIRKGSFNSLTKLQYLSINNNFLKTIPDLSSLTSLQILNLSNNKIEIIPTREFGNLSMLKVLSLSNNSLRAVGVESFANLMYLEKLDLSNNKLNHLPINWLTASDKLRVLDLRGNCFTEFKSLSLGNMKSLEIIFLQKNPLNYVNTGSLVNLPRNVSLYLENEYTLQCSKISMSNYMKLDSESSDSVTERLSKNITPRVKKIY